MKNKTIDEKERLLIEEIDFFNQNVLWWTNEVTKVSREIEKLESQGLAYQDEAKLEKLVASMNYLAGKARIEKIAASNIESKLNKLRLMKELDFIQGDLNFKSVKKKQEKQEKQETREKKG